MAPALRIARPSASPVPTREAGAATDLTPVAHPAPRLPYWERTGSVYPLVTFRVLFGLVAALGAARFLAEGWVGRLLLDTPFKFSFYGLAWVPQPGPAAAHALYVVILAAALCLAAGYRYRLAAPAFVASFAYAEVLDATHYLNHYYLVVLFGVLLCFMPAHAAWSLDARAGRVVRRHRIPAWCLHALQLQLALVYVFAGLAKVDADWLLRAMPLAIWLPEHAHWPLVGPLLARPWVAYVASWAGCLYDLTIVGFLLHPRTRRYAYPVVLGFHGATWALFNIGLFPLIMSTATLVFFPAAAHRRWWRRLHDWWTGGTALPPFEPGRRAAYAADPTRTPTPPLLRVGLVAFFALQLALPLRTLAYPGPATWSEEGYRFGWRVMLVEKVGTARFTVRDGETGRTVEVDHRGFLSDYQAKQMAIQPDFVLQFAHRLAAHYRQLGWSSPEVYADVHVALNGRRSRRLVDPAVDLAQERDGLSPKPWILPLQ